MKILYCIPSLSESGGTERIVTQKINFFLECEKQFDITIVTTEGIDKKPFYDLHPSAKVIELNIDFLEEFRKPLYTKYIGTKRKLTEYKKKLIQIINTQNIDICISTGAKELEFLSQIQVPCKKICELHFSKYNRELFFEGKKGRWNLCEFSVNEMAKQNCIFCSAFFRKSSWEKVRGYDINLIYGLEDWEFWISIIRKVSTNVYKIPEICFYYRVKNVSMIKNLNTDKRKIALDYISIKHVDFFVSEMGNFIELLDYKSQYEIILHNKSYKIFDKYFLKLWQIKEKIKNIFNSNELE